MFNKKLLKIVVTIFITLACVGAFGGATYYSFQKDQAKKAKKAIKAATQKVVKKEVKIDKSTYKTIALSEDFGRSNPFGPQSSMDNQRSSDDKYLTPPPLGGLDTSDTADVMTTTVSGIMYDEYNPSAIINIGGTEFFVKKNDNLNDYKILSISPNQVVVKYGNNIYKAGVGEIFSNLESNSNIVNLNKKFGGNTQDMIPISIRKR